MTGSILTAEIDRLQGKVAIYGDELIWQQNEFCEILPQPTPLSLSLLRMLASASGATGMVCQELGVDYSASVPMEDYLETIFGRTFVNSVAEKRLTSGAGTKKGLRKLLASAKLQAAAKTCYLDFTTTIAELDASYERQLMISPEELPEKELLQYIQSLVSDLNCHYRHVVKAGLFANLKLDELKVFITSDTLPMLLQANSLEVSGTNQTALAIHAYRDNVLPQLSGFSAEVEYELGCPRCGEITPRAEALPAPIEKRPLPQGLSSRTRKTLCHFKIYESLKVIYKTLLLRELSLVRSALLAYDKKCALDGGVFYLHLAELFSKNPGERLELIQDRQEKERAFRSIEVPTSIRATELPRLLTGTITPVGQDLKGLSVNGAEFSGQAVLYRNRHDLDKIVPGQIVVAKHASPDLVMLFNKASGIIAETGGLLSHLAIVAREQGFPVVLQIRHATAVINDDDWLTILQDGSVLIERDGVSPEGFSPSQRD